MATFSQSDIYPPESWAEFETIVTDVFQRKYPDVYFQRYGRQGQTQNGVDICGIGQFIPRVIGIQCKNHQQNVSKSQIKEEIRKAEKFEPTITEYFIVTKLKQDSKIQSMVYCISQERVGNNEFPVTLLYWEDIKQSLAEFPELISKHYPGNKGDINNLNYSALLDLSFYGNNLALYSQILLDPLNNKIEELITLLNSLMNATIFIRNLDSRITLENKLIGLSQYLNRFDNVYIIPDIGGIQTIAKEIESIVKGTDGNLTNVESIIYNLGSLLARWELDLFFSHVDRYIPKESILFFQDLLKGVDIPEYLVSEIQKKIKDINNIDEGKENLRRAHIPEMIILIIKRSFSIA